MENDQSSSPKTNSQYSLTKINSQILNVTPEESQSIDNILSIGTSSWEYLEDTETMDHGLLDDVCSYFHFYICFSKINIHHLSIDLYAINIHTYKSKIKN